MERIQGQADIMKRTIIWYALTIPLCVFLFPDQPILASDLPKATQEMITSLKLAGSPILKNLDEEASSAPNELIEAAKKEGGTLTINGLSRPDGFRKQIAPFHERYPFIKVTSNLGNNFARTVKPLVAFKEGRIITDIVEGAGEELNNYKKENALLKIDDLPNFWNAPIDMRDKEGYYVGSRAQQYCMAYNTNKIKESDLPSTWDDLLTKENLRNGRIAMGSNPNLFMIMLWSAKGEDWSMNFMDQLFKTVKPQLRKEQPTAQVGLVAAGELDIVLPAAAYRVSQFKNKGAPVGFHCPLPVPISWTPIMIIKGTPHPATAKLYVNWLLSKEGQIAQYYADGSSPVHKDLQTAAFIPFSDQILQRESALRTPELLETEMPKVSKIWQSYWINSP
jgi:ABC-type Fe3+ transport system substrate-binding protein